MLLVAPIPYGTGHPRPFAISASVSYCGALMRLSGETIARLRYRQGWSLTDLAENTGLTKSYLSKIERGLRQGSPRSAKVIADALGVYVEDITVPIETTFNMQKVDLGDLEGVTDLETGEPKGDHLPLTTDVLVSRRSLMLAPWRALTSH